MNIISVCLFWVLIWNNIFWESNLWRAGVIQIFDLIYWKPKVVLKNVWYTLFFHLTALNKNVKTVFHLTTKKWPWQQTKYRLIISFISPSILLNIFHQNLRFLRYLLSQFISGTQNISKIILKLQIIYLK